MEGRRPWCSQSSNSMLTITGYMRKAQPTPWWFCRAFTQAMPSSTLTSLLVWVHVVLPLVPQTGGNIEMIAIHLCEVHYWMAIACEIFGVFASMTGQNIQDHWSECKRKLNKECAEHYAHEG